MNQWRARELGRQGRSFALVVTLLAVPLMLTPIWVPALANGQDTCPQDDGWTKVDSDDLSLYPVDGATEYCFKAGSSNSQGCEGGIFDSWPQPEDTCGLSHWSYFIPDDPTDEPPPTPAPTDAPTPTPTDEPHPTVTPTDEGCSGECDVTPTPTDPPSIEPTPTSIELPQTGDGLSPEAWLCWGKNVWCSHNGVDGSEGELWVFLYPGALVEFRGVGYVVQHVDRVTPQAVSVLDDADNYDLVLLTCSSYIGGVWVNRVIIFANLSEGG